MLAVVTVWLNVQWIAYSPSVFTFDNYQLLVMPVMLAGTCDHAKQSGLMRLNIKLYYGIITRLEGVDHA
jgi:hypothetical protein